MSVILEALKGVTPDDLDVLDREIERLKAVRVAVALLLGEGKEDADSRPGKPSRLGGKAPTIAERALLILMNAIDEPVTTTFIHQQLGDVNKQHLQRTLGASEWFTRHQSDSRETCWAISEKGLDWIVSKAPSQPKSESDGSTN